jgi:hypothetical protein
MPKPAYAIRESSRAKHVRITLLLRDGLVVVVPRGFDRSRIPGILEKKKRWLQKAQQKIAKQRQFVGPEPSGTLPARLALLGIGEDWAVDYRQTESPHVTVLERPGNRLLVSGDTDNTDACKAALGRWLKRKGHEHLTPWLGRLADEHGFEFTRVIIGTQRTRWGSCSSRKTISLNAKLLFIPEDLIKYTLLHELCHTKRLDHSRKFWALVKQLDPDYRPKDKRLRAAWRIVPAWLES